MYSEHDDKHEACGVFGIFTHEADVAKLTYYALYALQHRGQESAGIAVSDGKEIMLMKDMGLVSQVFSERDLQSLKGHQAVGHVRYSTTGSPFWGEFPAHPGPLAAGVAHRGPQRQPHQH